MRSVAEKAFRLAVGEMAHSASQLEATVAITTWGLAGLEQDLARIVCPNGMDGMLKLIRRLAPVRVDDSNLRADLLDWVAKVRQAYDERSSVLHSTWSGPGDDGPHTRLTLRPLGRPLETRTAADVQDLRAEMDALITVAGSTLKRLAATVAGPWSVSAS